MHYSNIEIKVGLNDQKVPEDIKWRATDSDNPQFTDAKAFFLSLWDPMDDNTLSINLWTKDLQTHEMHALYFRSMIQITESYVKATQNPFAHEMMKEFVQNLSKKTVDWEESKQTA